MVDETHENERVLERQITQMHLDKKLDAVYRKFKNYYGSGDFENASRISKENPGLLCKLSKNEIWGMLNFYFEKYKDLDDGD